MAESCDMCDGIAASGRRGVACEVWCWVRVQIWLNCLVVLVALCLYDT